MLLHNGNRRENFRMTPAQEKRVSAALKRVFRRLTGAGPATKDRRTHDFIFHMTDWYGDLIRLARIMERPDGKSSDEWFDAVYGGFLIHASGHLLAATKL